jgi:hypothetical protein
MNLTSGIFTAPRPGTYFFTFTGNIQYEGTASSPWNAWIFFFLNNKRVAFKRISDSIGDVYRELTIQSTLSLKAGDQIWLELLMSEGVFLYDIRNNGYNHFTGMLMEENLAGRL